MDGTKINKMYSTVLSIFDLFDPGKGASGRSGLPEHQRDRVARSDRAVTAPYWKQSSGLRNTTHTIHVRYAE